MTPQDVKAFIDEEPLLQSFSGDFNGLNGTNNLYFYMTPDVVDHWNKFCENIDITDDKVGEDTSLGLYLRVFLKFNGAGRIMIIVGLRREVTLPRNINVNVFTNEKTSISVIESLNRVFNHLSLFGLEIY